MKLKKINMSTKREEVAQSDMSDTENFFFADYCLYTQREASESTGRKLFFFFQGCLVPSLQNVLFRLVYLEKDYLFVTQ